MSEKELYRQYDEYIDELYGEINVGVRLRASYVLKECDPVAYDCGFDDWSDCEDVEE